MVFLATRVLPPILTAITFSIALIHCRQIAFIDSTPPNPRFILHTLWAALQEKRLGRGAKVVRLNWEKGWRTETGEDSLPIQSTTRQIAHPRGSSSAFSSWHWQRGSWAFLSDGAGVGTFQVDYDRKLTHRCVNHVVNHPHNSFFGLLLRDPLAVGQVCTVSVADHPQILLDPPQPDRHYERVPQRPRTIDLQTHLDTLINPATKVFQRQSKDLRHCA
ncbi:hypothetical protein NMY22_g11819 [Coprinellus aureogranulatus]|nr:hypothetical protein NMY22_g11819 [Coprinellus aureogranulatus]